MEAFGCEPGLERISIGRFEFNEHLPLNHIHLHATRFDAAGRKYAFGELAGALARQASERV